MAGKPSKAAKRGATATGSKKAPGRVAGKKYKSGAPGFKTYIFRVLKKLEGKSHMAIGKKTMSILNSFLIDLFDRIGREAGSVCGHSGK